MSTLPENDKPYISSVELIKITGISRATLNNYIKLGLLPKPLVTRPDNPESRAKRLGYYPDSVIQSVEKIFMLKKAGKRIPEIAAQTCAVELHEQDKVDDYRPTIFLPKEEKPRETIDPDGLNEELLARENGVPSHRSNFIKELFKKRLPTLVPFSVLVADLQDSMRICAELCPEEYFDLINQIWTAMEGSFHKYYGTYGRNTGVGMVYFFIEEGDSQYLFNAIKCSLELREKMKILNLDWKIRKRWDNELYLNIGINEGQEYFGTITAAPNIELTVLGDSVQRAMQLSGFARSGSIWTTKNMMNKLSLEERNIYRFGIKKKRHEEVILVENTFSRVMDLLTEEDLKHMKLMDYAILPITEIIGEKA